MMTAPTTAINRAKKTTPIMKSSSGGGGNEIRIDTFFPSFVYCVREDVFCETNETNEREKNNNWTLGINEKISY